MPATNKHRDCTPEAHCSQACPKAARSAREDRIDPDALARRATAEWSRLAGEPVTVECIKGTLYAYGSELASLRLLKAFRHSRERADSGFSTNLGTWYFRLDRQ